MKFYRGVALSRGLICTKILSAFRTQQSGLYKGVSSNHGVHLGLSKVAFIKECPQIMGGLYEGFDCNGLYCDGDNCKVTGPSGR